MDLVYFPFIFLIGENRKLNLTFGDDTKSKMGVYAIQFDGEDHSMDKSTC